MLAAATSQLKLSVMRAPLPSPALKAAKTAVSADLLQQHETCGPHLQCTEADPEQDLEGITTIVDCLQQR